MKKRLIGLAALLAACSPHNEYRNLGEQCGQIQLERGTYPVKKEGWDAIYTVQTWDSGKNCYLALSNPELSVEMRDDDCDNTIDRIGVEEYPLVEYRIGLRGDRIDLSLDRAALSRLGYTKPFDKILEEAQQFACPENKRHLEEYLLKRVLEIGNK